jgi:hypothetical protein
MASCAGKDDDNARDSDRKGRTLETSDCGFADRNRRRRAGASRALAQFRLRRRIEDLAHLREVGNRARDGRRGALRLQNRHPATGAWYDSPYGDFRVRGVRIRRLPPPPSSGRSPSPATRGRSRHPPDGVGDFLPCREAAGEGDHAKRGGGGRHGARCFRPSANRATAPSARPVGQNRRKRKGRGEGPLLVLLVSLQEMSAVYSLNSSPTTA